MPISRREFELGGPSPQAFLQALFEANPDLAFSFSQILENLRKRGFTLEQNQVKEVLDGMEERGIIESEQTAAGETYYIMRRRPLGFAPPRR